MSTTLAGPVSAGKPWTYATPVALATFAVVILLAASFVLGRATVGNQHAPAVSTGTAAQTSAASSVPDRR